MTDVTFTDTGRGLSPKRLKLLERQLDGELPADYRDFLTKINGGTPDKTYFTVPKTGEELWVTQFLRVGEQLAVPQEEAVSETISFFHHAFGDEIPDDALIIGVAVSEELLLLRHRGTQRGQIALKYMSRLGVTAGSLGWAAAPPGSLSSTRSQP